MKVLNLINIAFITPPLTGHFHRGSGTYFHQLLINLQKFPGIKVSQVSLNNPLFAFDLIHFPYFDPYFITMPHLRNLGKAPLLVTVHDLIPLKYPDKILAGFFGLIKWNIQRNSLERASLIITDSKSSKEDIYKITGIKKDKIHVVYLGVDPVFRKIENMPSLKKTSLKYKLPEKFLLHVGDVNYNKNIPGILKAFAEINREFPDLHLVFVGRGFIDPTPQLEEILKIIKETGLTDKVVRIAGIETEELADIYNLSKVLLLPSFAEGFGLPVLEAFACQTPVVAGNSGSLPEIAGTACLFADPFDYLSIAQNIRLFLTDENQRQTFILKGKERVKDFTWQKTARNTAALYLKALGFKDYQLK